MPKVWCLNGRPRTSACCERPESQSGRGAAKIAGAPGRRPVPCPTRIRRCDFLRSATNHRSMLTTTDIHETRGRPAMKRNQRDAADFLARIGRAPGHRPQGCAVLQPQRCGHAATSSRKSLRSCGSPGPHTTRHGRSRPGCTASRSTSRSRSHAANAGTSPNPPPSTTIVRAPGDDGDVDRAQGVRELRAFIASLDELNRALILLYLDELSYARSPTSSASAKPTSRPRSTA